jgi:hypothetical protein
LIDHFGVVSDSDAIHFHGVALVHQIKQSWKSIAETYAAAAAMTDVVNTLKLFIQIGLIPKLWVILIQGVPGGRVEAAFSTMLCHRRSPC